MHARLSQTLSARGVAIGTAVIVAAGVSVIVHQIGAPGRALASERSPSQLSAPRARAALIEAGLGPDRLTASGAQAASVSAAATAAMGELRSRWATMQTQRAALGQARAQVETLERAARSGTATHDQLASLVIARGQLATASEAMTSVLGSITTVGTAPLSPSMRSALTAMAEPRGDGLPVPYRLLGAPEAEAVGLREALAQERGASAADPLPASAATLLTSARADAGVSAALTALDAHLAANTAAFDAAVAALSD